MRGRDGGAGRDTLLRFAREMRKTPAATERLLWRLLRDRRMEGLKFRRQEPIEGYIVDFVCYRHRLIVEADGPTHETEEGRAYDAERDARLGACGFRLLRFSNMEISSRRERVVEAILTAAGATPHPSASPTPSPARGEG